jgi:hypothetical protein
MKLRLPWNTVKEYFNDQWVELTDYEWDWNSPVPEWAIVGNHAANRSELISRLNGANEGSESSVQKSIILYVGASHPLQSSTPVSL